MPLPGGPSAKAGQRYETLWTVMCITQVMRGEAESIRLEPPSVDGEGIEFYVKSPSGIEYHQVKRQRTGKGRWPLGILASERVLSVFYQKLDNPDATCVFVSAHAADTLQELADRAIDANSWEELERYFVSSDQWSGHFDELHSRWGSRTREDTYQRLKRIRVRTVDEDFLRDSVRSRLEVLVDGDPDNVSDVLSGLAINRIHHELDSSAVWDHLETISKWQVAIGDGTTGVRTQAAAIRCSSTPFCRSVPEQHGTWRAMLESVPQPTGAQDTACAQNRPTSPRRCVGCVADSRVWRRLDDPKDCHTPCPSTGAVGHPW